MDITDGPTQEIQKVIDAYLDDMHTGDEVDSEVLAENIARHLGLLDEG